ncbi:MAG TPA: OsmC family peroxiredoxin [Candidatus Atribacteria bacterium]|nr:OsmC family peroxiredoxin [Candidatus Atribacteria bacterium]
MSSIITGQTSRLSIESREEKMNIRTYKAKTKWIEGNKAETEIREFRVGIDEPVELRGTNTAPNPVELLLAALGGCVVLTYRAYAKKYGIEIENLVVNLEGDMIRGGWVDENRKERKAFKEIRYEVKIKTKASAEKVNQLHKLVEEKCPVTDMLVNPTEVKGIVSIG